MSVGRVSRLQVCHGLEIRRPLHFLSGCEAIYTGLESAPAMFVAPTPPLPVLLGHLQDATAAQRDVGRVKGAVPVRDAKFRVLLTSIESEVCFVQGLVDASPELGPSLISAASMKAGASPGHPKPLLAAKNILPSGTVLLDANASLLDSTYRAKVFCWQHTLDGTTWITTPTTPTGTTTIRGLPPLTRVGFQVSVAVLNQPQGAWSQTVSLLIV